MGLDSATRAERVAQTRASFEYQWSRLPNGAASLADAAFREDVPGEICRLTGLDAGWFAGKRVLDAGCGPGRFAFGFCALGARVTVLDVSASALGQARAGCACFPQFTGGVVADLCRPLPLAPAFDLVWSYGVLHHTGDTRAAFGHLAAGVASGGHLFVMLYGEPRPDRLDDYRAYVWLEAWRLRCRHLSFPAIAEKLRGLADERDLLAWFDAVTPWINDRHDYAAVQSWFERHGFVDVRRRTSDMDHYVIGRRAG